MESHIKKNLLNVKEEGKDLLKKYIKYKEKQYLQKAMDIDNTNPETLYYYFDVFKNNISSYNTIYLYMDHSSIKNFVIEWEL